MFGEGIKTTGPLVSLDGLLIGGSKGGRQKHTPGPIFFHFYAIFYPKFMGCWPEHAKPGSATVLGKKKGMVPYQ